MSDANQDRRYFDRIIIFHQEATTLKDIVARFDRKGLTLLDLDLVIEKLTQMKDIILNDVESKRVDITQDEKHMS